jgi:hypothetical protein
MNEEETPEHRKQRVQTLIKGLKETLSAIRKYIVYLDDLGNSKNRKQLEIERKKEKSITETIKFLEENSNG